MKENKPREHVQKDKITRTISLIAITLSVVVALISYFSYRISKLKFDLELRPYLMISDTKLVTDLKVPRVYISAKNIGKIPATDINFKAVTKVYVKGVFQKPVIKEVETDPFPNVIFPDETYIYRIHVPGYWVSDSTGFRCELTWEYSDVRGAKYEYRDAANYEFYPDGMFKKSRIDTEYK